MPSQNNIEKSLPDINRHITTHNNQGAAVYSKDLQLCDFWTIHTAEGHSADFELGYITEDFPIPLGKDQDLSTFKKAYANKMGSGLVKHGGSILRYCDIPPGSRSPMHRTVSLDYGIVIVGELECLLDSGETRTVRPGDLVVQRGTLHQWINRTDEWARIVFVLFHASPVEIGGTRLDEVQGGMSIPLSH
ncbi:cupin domain containing [Fusarium albosuccineum]|uniref:Cupin domain containing n=1 Tax=Fusarium albosuccineum TaxID=1237068 RepID=A0A8H4KTY2_9HYPO|nr:cupin domain containing [Fusarium albosuccineum]